MKNFSSGQNDKQNFSKRTFIKSLSWHLLFFKFNSDSGKWQKIYLALTTCLGNELFCFSRVEMMNDIVELVGTFLGFSINVFVTLFSIRFVWCHKSQVNHAPQKVWHHLWMIPSICLDLKGCLFSSTGTRKLRRSFENLKKIKTHQWWKLIKNLQIPRLFKIFNF